MTIDPLLSPVVFSLHPLHHLQNRLFSDVVCQFFINVAGFLFFPTGSITCVGPGSSSTILDSCRRETSKTIAGSDRGEMLCVHLLLQTSLYRLFSSDELQRINTIQRRYNVLAVRYCIHVWYSSRQHRRRHGNRIRRRKFDKRSPSPPDFACKVPSEPTWP